MFRVHAKHIQYPLLTPFRISRGAKTHADVVEVTLEGPQRTVQAEAVPYPRYGESVERTLEAIESVGQEHATLAELEEKVSRLSGSAANAMETAIFALTHPGACRNALQGFSVADTSRTIAIDTPEKMAAMAKADPTRVLKIKLAGDGLDLDRIAAVHNAVPTTPLWLDANEGLSESQCAAMMPRLEALNVVVVEQPFAADSPKALPAAGIPFCADEAFHTETDAERVAQIGYHAVNIKLDKAGGIIRAEKAAEMASALGLTIVVGCMVSSSLAIAAGWVLVRRLREKGIAVPYVDLDGATFLAQDRDLHGTGWEAAPDEIARRQRVPEST